MVLVWVTRLAVRCVIDVYGRPLDEWRAVLPQDVNHVFSYPLDLSE
jgi:hypothetical protein